MSKVLIYIDGANFFYGIKSVNERYTDLNFDFSKYILNVLVKEGDEVLQIYYYNAPLKNLKGCSKLYSKQQSFFKRLRNTKKFKVILCKRQKRLNNLGEEFHMIKGDDIHLAVDLIKDIYEKKADKIILMSGDGDFEPAIKLAKDKNKIVNLCYFENSISKNIYNITNEKFLVNKKILNKYLYRWKK
jgi:uncharacterized LabA/DUF88 family protein